MTHDPQTTQLLSRYRIARESYGVELWEIGGDDSLLLAGEWTDAELEKWLRGREAGRAEAASEVLAIEDGIPFPSDHKPPPNKKYPIRDLSVGQSFFAPGEKVRLSLQATISRITRTTGRRFTVRTLTENGVRGARVWRLA